MIPKFSRNLIQVRVPGSDLFTGPSHSGPESLDRNRSEEAGYGKGLVQGTRAGGSEALSEPRGCPHNHSHGYLGSARDVFDAQQFLVELWFGHHNPV